VARFILALRRSGICGVGWHYFVREPVLLFGFCNLDFICYLDFANWIFGEWDCHTSPSLCSGLWLTAMTGEAGASQRQRAVCHKDSTSLSLTCALLRIILL
jgi:hypothetical protein